MCTGCGLPTGDTCDPSDVADVSTGHGLPRRALLRRLGALGVVGLMAGPLAGTVDLLTGTSALASVRPDPRFLTRAPTIHPRKEWAGSSCPPTGPLPMERPGDVKFLLGHHTYLPGNSYQAHQVPGMLRQMYAYHTGPKKNWHDIAYNFLVDRYGNIWEGRLGSLAHPVIPSATGGSQGYDQIVCWIGDHTTAEPTPQAMASMISTFAWLADTFHIDTRPGAKVTFTSRGSNRYPRGTAVTTRTLEGHRAMSQTSCPGDAAYSYFAKLIPTEVTKLRGLQP